MSCCSFDSTSATASTPAWHQATTRWLKRKPAKARSRLRKANRAYTKLHCRVGRMKHKFNVSPEVARVAGREASPVPYRIGAPQREIEHRAATVKFHDVAGARRLVAAVRCSARRCPIQEMLLAPFRSGTTHIVSFRPIFAVRPVPGWTEKRQQGADGAAEKGNQYGCGERNSSHVILHAKG